MAKLFKKMFNFIGMDDGSLEDEEQYGEEYEQDHQAPAAYDNVIPMGSRSGKRPGSAPQAQHSAMPGSMLNQTQMPPQLQAQMKMIVYYPVSYEDTENIVDNLKSRKPVIVNMEKLDDTCAQRILDYLVGAVYALDAAIYKVSSHSAIYVAVPGNYDVIGNMNNDFDGEGDKE